MSTFRVIPNEVKEQILNRIKNEGITAAQAARDAGIADNTVYGWLAKSVNGKTNDGEVARLKRELQGAYERIGKLTKELDAYKKRTDLGAELMKENAMLTQKITQTALAKTLGISRQSLYYQKQQPLLDEEVKGQIEAVLSEHPAYGHKRIALALKRNKKRILRVMKKFGIKPYRPHVRAPRKKEDECIGSA